MEQKTEVIGYTGQLTITENKVIITRRGIGGLLAKGLLNGAKEIPIKSITAIQFVQATWLTNGHIQFSIHGEMGHKRGAISAVNDENTVLFTYKQRERFANAKALIDELMQKQSTPSVNVNVGVTSIADEIEKLNKLLGGGIITQSEFESQKAKLLA